MTGAAGGTKFQLLSVDSWSPFSLNCVTTKSATVNLKHGASCMRVPEAAFDNCRKGRQAVAEAAVSVSIVN
jgi:hypothetical protein